jgi:hypothetical protein
VWDSFYNGIKPQNKIENYFRTNISNDLIKEIYNKLTEKGFISKDNTDIEGFLYVFGGDSSKFTSYRITWLKSQQLLRELLTAIKPDYVTMAGYERTAKLVFIKDGEPVELPKSKKGNENNPNTKVMKKIIEYIKQNSE